MSVIDLVVPDIGGHSGVDVIDVAVRVGDMIEKEQTLVTLETDKATMDVPAAQAGEVVESLVLMGQKVSEGDILFRLKVTEAKASSAAVSSQNHPSSSEQTRPSQSPPEASVSESPQSSIPEETALSVGHEVVSPHASPSVRRMARELGVNLSQVSGSGPRGRIVKEDVQTFVKKQLTSGASSGKAVPPEEVNGLQLLPWPQVDFAKFGPVESVDRSKIKKISGENLARNWAMIPHVTQFDQTDITDLESFRKDVVAELKEQGVKLTLLSFLIKATAFALREFPEFNSSLDGDRWIMKKYYHIGFAADTPQGLVVPVLRDADQKGLVDIAKEAAALATRAREGKLMPQDMQGGCFSISSLGGIGGTAFTPIINAPEVAILGVSKSQLQPVWDGQAFEPRLMLPLSLSYDHRVIDGALAARFTSFLGKLLSDVRRLML